MPVQLISPWNGAQKMTEKELLEMKQLRNYMEVHRQNDGLLFIYIY